MSGGVVVLVCSFAALSVLKRVREYAVGAGGATVESEVLVLRGRDGRERRFDLPAMKLSRVGAVLVLESPDGKRLHVLLSMFEQPEALDHAVRQGTSA
jgi:hypothetical protein